jgi:hypothetical protein
MATARERWLFGLILALFALAGSLGAMWLTCASALLPPCFRCRACSGTARAPTCARYSSPPCFRRLMPPPPPAGALGRAPPLGRAARPPACFLVGEGLPSQSCNTTQPARRGEAGHAHQIPCELEVKRPCRGPQLISTTTSLSAGQPGAHTHINRAHRMRCYIPMPILAHTPTRTSSSSSLSDRCPAPRGPHSSPSSPSLSNSVRRRKRCGTWATEETAVRGLRLAQSLQHQKHNHPHKTAQHLHRTLSLSPCLTLQGRAASAPMHPHNQHNHKAFTAPINSTHPPPACLTRHAES